jgi:hypothetical protein
VRAEEIGDRGLTTLHPPHRKTTQPRAAHHTTARLVPW